MWLEGMGNSINKSIEKDPVGFNLKLATNLMIANAFVATEPQPYSGNYTSNQTTLEGVGGYQYWSKSPGMDIALGVSEHLYDFSNVTGYADYTQFSSGGFNQGEIQAAIENPNNRIHFNLQGFSMKNFLKYVKNPVAPDPALRNVSNWELYLIKNTPGAIERATFHNIKNGIYQTVPNPF